MRHALDAALRRAADFPRSDSGSCATSDVSSGRNSTARRRRTTRSRRPRATPCRRLARRAARSAVKLNRDRYPERVARRPSVACRCSPCRSTSRRCRNPGTRSRRYSDPGQQSPTQPGERDQRSQCVLGVLQAGTIEVRRRGMTPLDNHSLAKVTMTSAPGHNQKISVARFGSSGKGLAANIWVAGDRIELFQQLRAISFSGKADSAHHSQCDGSQAVARGE